MDKWGKLERRPREGEKVVMRGSEGQKDACDLTAERRQGVGDVERGETGEENILKRLYCLKIP